MKRKWKQTHKDSHNGKVRITWGDQEGNHIHRRTTSVGMDFELVKKGGTIYDLWARTFDEAKKDAEQYLGLDYTTT